MIKFLKKSKKKLSTFSASWRIQLSTGARLREKGFSLIETIVYIGLLAIIISGVIYLLLNIFNTLNLAVGQKEVMTNMQFAIDTITEEVKFSKNIYTPTSAFDQNSGQLSIETNQNPPAGETAKFIDFYLDNGRIYMKNEGQTEIPITSNQIKINKLKFKYLNPSNAPEGVQIFAEGQFNTTNTNLANQTLLNLTTSAIIRYR